MHVARRLAPRHDPARHGKRVPAQREAADAHALLQPRERLAERDALEPAPELVVVDRQQGQVALDADGEHAGDDLGVGAAAAALDGDVVVDAVGVLLKKKTFFFVPSRRTENEKGGKGESERGERKDEKKKKESEKFLDQTHSQDPAPRDGKAGGRRRSLPPLGPSVF